MQLINMPKVVIVAERDEFAPGNVEFRNFGVLRAGQQTGTIDILRVDLSAALLGRPPFDHDHPPQPRLQADYSVERGLSEASLLDMRDGHA